MTRRREDRAANDAAFRERVERARRVDLAGLIGRTVKLRKAGREFSGLCPFHGEATASFTVVPDKGFAHCFGCGWHGDAIRFVMDSQRVSFAEALGQLDGGEVSAAPAGAAGQRESRKVERGGDFIEGRRAAAWAWGAGAPARGSGLAEAWLRGRGIDPMGNGLLDVARFLPRCPAGLWPVHDDPLRRPVHAPALVVPIVRVSGGRGARQLSLSGVHVALLASDGAGKARLPERRDGSPRPARLMWGVAARGGVPIPVLPAPGERALAEFLAAQIDAPGQLVVGEGLETTQSLLARVPDARMGWATLSLGNLEGVAAKDGPQGSLALWKLRGEAELGAPFTLAEPGATLIGVDADMKPLKNRLVQERPGGPAIRRDITGAERTAICAALASWHWTRAGATSVKVARPPAGADFNDLDMGAAA